MKSIIENGLCAYDFQGLRGKKKLLKIILEKSQKKKGRETSKEIESDSSEISSTIDMLRPGKKTLRLRKAENLLSSTHSGFQGCLHPFVLLCLTTMHWVMDKECYFFFTHSSGKPC